MPLLDLVVPFSTFQFGVFQLEFFPFLPIFGTGLVP
jgi:hypothetical protein